MNPSDRLRAAIQGIVGGDGWQLNQYVLAVGLERIGPDGSVESTAWVWSPAEQPYWITDGLLAAAMDLRDTHPTND